MTVTGRRAVFLDRDGVLNRATMRDGKPYPPASLSELEILPDTAAVLAMGGMPMEVAPQAISDVGLKIPNAGFDITRQIASRSEFATSPPFPSCANTSRSLPVLGSTTIFTCIFPKGVICLTLIAGIMSGILTGLTSWSSSLAPLPSFPEALPVSAIGWFSRHPSR